MPRPVESNKTTVGGRERQKRDDRVSSTAFGNGSEIISEVVKSSIDRMHSKIKDE